MQSDVGAIMTDPVFDFRDETPELGVRLMRFRTHLQGSLDTLHINSVELKSQLEMALSGWARANDTVALLQAAQNAPPPPPPPPPGSFTCQYISQNLSWNRKSTKNGPTLIALFHL